MDTQGIIKILVSLKDQEKTTLTCPFRVFAYRRMPFGLCNAPATFQRYMNAIFSNMVEKCIKVIMDDFSIFRDSFTSCLNNLEKVLERCIEKNLVLNWQKVHFMVTEGIVLEYKILARGIEVDQAKIKVIEKLPPHRDVKGVRSFLGTLVSIEGSYKISLRLLSPSIILLVKENLFHFNEECLQAFDLLKKLVTAPVIVTPNWGQEFKLMCYASDYVIGEVLRQKRNERFHVIYYANKLLNGARINYASMEKEMLAMVYAFQKFRSYLVGSKIIVRTDHSTIKYLLTKKV